MHINLYTVARSLITKDYKFHHRVINTVILKQYSKFIIHLKPLNIYAELNIMNVLRTLYVLKYRTQVKAKVSCSVLNHVIINRN